MSYIWSGALCVALSWGQAVFIGHKIFDKIWFDQKYADCIGRGVNEQ